YTTLFRSLGRELGHGARAGADEEQRVVAEAAGSARRARDPPFTRAVGGDQALGVDQRERAAEARGALFVRHLGERRQELGVVGRVVVRFGVPRRAHAGRAAERVDLQAAVVR